MNFLFQTAASAHDPIEAVVRSSEDVVLAVITGVEGPSYRPVGAAMAVFANGELAGTLSSGCVEADIALHAMEALATGVPRGIRYGRGSPFMDIQLPCGGGLDVLLVPRPDRSVLSEVVRKREAREPCTLGIDLETGRMSLGAEGQTGRADGGFRVRYVPPVRFLVFGKGPEACTFAALARSAGYPGLLLSPDPETIGAAAASGCPTQQLSRPVFPEDLSVDPWTAIILFFHDHDWEPPILQGALATRAFYIGAQGSRRARDMRHMALEANGVSPDDISRLRGPIGLIPSARDAGTLAVSVLAEVLAVSMQDAAAAP